ncbi:MAG: ATP-binding cassette domain-containing protein, partial [Oscillospiraceae bacterium]
CVPASTCKIQMRALVGRRACDKGRIEWGRNVRLSVYEQDSSELHSEKTAIEELWDRFPGETEHGLRTLIGGLGLTGDESFKKVGVLSGGERARIKLAIAMLEQGNVLVMDEPTNHLDIPAKEALEAALLAFDGTVLVVSHDRWLLSRLPTRILRLADGTAELFEGGFETMQAQLAARDAENAGSADKLRDEPEKSERGGEYHRSRAQRSAEAAQKRRTAELEQQIAEIEQALLEAERQMEDPAVAGDYQALSELTRQMEELHDSLDGFYAEWDTLL